MIRYSNNTNLKSIKILGLFNKFDVNIPFDNNVNIYIGENGVGKTTILNCIYYILSLKLNKLNSIPFDEIIISYKDDTSDTLKKKFIKPPFPTTFTKKLLNKKYNIDIDIDSNISNTLKEKIINDYIFSHLNEYLFDEQYEKKVYSKQNKLNIEKKINEKPLYLPTYRRIENSFNNKLTEKIKDEYSINFGMSDVTESINKILEEIKVSSINQFNKMTSKLLKQALKSEPQKEISFDIDIKTVEIILNRLSNVISSKDKENILNIFKFPSYKFNNDYKFLLNFMQQLVINYNKEQKKYDDKINNFVNTCNKYFTNKAFYYNPNTLELQIYWDDDTNNRTPISLNELSSGEKQIVSLFNKLYLDTNDTTSYIIIIDEPELSLSLFWQKMLLPDIMATNKCKLLLTVTHSPFIFDNEFKSFAKDIKRYITPIKDYRSNK